MTLCYPVLYFSMEADMSKKQDRIDTAKAVCHAASLYKANLVGRKSLYFFDNRYIEVIYKTDSFKHLTGVESNLSANAFYKLAVRGKLTEKQIYFTSTHPFSLCQRKLKHLDSVATLATAESFMLEEIATSTRTYKFGTTDLNFSLCFNQQFDAARALLNEVFHVESLRDEDCFSKSKSAYDIVAILYKQNSDKVYNHFAFLNKSFHISNLPEKVRKLCSEDFLSGLPDIYK